MIFNRPEYTFQVFESISLYKPDRIYIAADGPRVNYKEDILLCNQTRNIINHIDWKCEVKTLFREENLGCKLAVVSSINWFFDNEEDGIILEDDIVPNQDFYTFCEFTLNMYKNDERIMMITGSNFLIEDDLSYSYFFSKLYCIWGWATWKRAWQLYDIDMKKWDDNQIRLNMKYMSHKNYIWMNLKFTYDSLKNYNIDTWDIQWDFTCAVNNGLCITPKVNLITNIGVIGTHSNKITDVHFLEKYSFDDPINYTLPNSFLINSLYDQKIYEKKARKANRRYLIINFLIVVRLYKFLKLLKNKLIK